MEQSEGTAEEFPDNSEPLRSRIAKTPSDEGVFAWTQAYRTLKQSCLLSQHTNGKHLETADKPFPYIISLAEKLGGASGR